MFLLRNKTLKADIHALFSPQCSLKININAILPPFGIEGKDGAKDENKDRIVYDPLKKFHSA